MDPLSYHPLSIPLFLPQEHIDSKVHAKILKIVAIVTLGILAVTLALAWILSDNTVNVSTDSNHSCEAENGVVASDDERCSTIGLNVLRDGGNAVDAAVATALCEGVVNPMSSGIGGGAFLLVRLANGTLVAYDMREVAPAASSKDMYNNTPSSKSEGALSVAVPGEIAGLHLAWQHFGRRPWKSLFEPAIKLACEGFEVTRYLEFEINGTLESIMRHKHLREWLSPNGTLVKAGDVLRNEELANTLELIANEGPSVFYNGTVGEKLVKDVRDAGGIITMEDLRNYKVEVREPLVNDVMGFTVFGMPPPASGGATIALILNILSNFGNISAVPDDLHYHRLVEAFKHGYAVRANLADPAFANISSVLHDMLSPEFARTLYKKIVDNATFPPEYYGGKWNTVEDHGTSHFGIVDRDRNAISLTTTVNAVFGSKVLSGSTGILLNNEMDDFAAPSDPPGEYPPAENNFIEPFKRPLSSMSPIIILENGQLRGVLGASGGIKIITGVAQVFLNYFIRGKDPVTAVTTPRVHHHVCTCRLIPNQVSSENWTLVTGERVEVAREIRESLSSKGYNVVETDGHCITQFVLQDLNRPISSTNTVYHGKLIGVSDFRKDGNPACF